ncbi:DUF6783 domain-containing protein [Blautia glucerasea]|uniref:DUF6783 domain-containing protein n=1 Tax=Blautia glucerasea TaxID=536633 RepID=UPI00296F5E97|nr:DUF6783 domain-containing protein [Blautia glucerasea]
MKNCTKNRGGLFTLLTASINIHFTLRACLRIRAKYTAKWGVQIAGMIFQTRSSYRHLTIFDILRKNT